ncbi:hypothetical protein Taro_006750 [Colocasia esculenta]|uniref:Survival protein SurE-like phosphatase/nucleotidase domain-containing protein n=1 Tax=Colocasia esculenta TaxID=4460 RepID=A0A843TTA5_COLES|nr:hypothetical protein [Colocasia esculenta]
MTTSSTSIRNNHLPPSLVANLQNVLAGRNAAGEGREEETKPEPEESAAAPSSSSSPEVAESNSAPSEPKPVILVTNSDGIGAPGLTSLVDALVREGRFDVHVCAPEGDKSLSGHSFTARETLIASSTEIIGATAFEVSGTPVDCVSLALSGELFSWSRPTLVISGISKGPNCGHRLKKDESQDSDFKVAADVCLPLIHAVLSGIENGVHKSGLLSIEIPFSPATNKVYIILFRVLSIPEI